MYQRLRRGMRPACVGGLNTSVMTNFRDTGKLHDDLWNLLLRAASESFGQYIRRVYVLRFISEWASFLS